MKTIFTAPSSILIMLIFYISITPYCFGQTINLDPAFGTSGIASIDIGNDEWVNDMCLQADGKIIEVGIANDTVTDYNYGVIVRFNADGSIDNTFSTDGKDTISTGVFSSNETFYYAIDVQPDNKIIAAGTYDAGAQQAILLVCYNEDGSRDETFGESGLVKNNFNDPTDEDSPIYYFDNIDMKLLDDGKILLAGRAAEDIFGPTYAFIARFKSDGTPDSTFDIDGLILQSLGSTFDYLYFSHTEFTDDGKIVMTGAKDNYLEDNRNLLIARFNTDGTLDETFGTGGYIEERLEGLSVTGQWGAVQPDNKVVVSFYAYKNDDWEIQTIGTMRYTENGVIDSTWNEDGIIETPVDRFSRTTLSLQPDGRIYLMCSDAYLDVQLKIYRYNTDGTFDDSFGSDGVGIINCGDMHLESYAGSWFQSDGIMLIPSVIKFSGYDYFSIAAYHPCSAVFTLYPDAEPHNWNALSVTTGTEPFIYLWQWGDGETSTEAYPSHTYDEEGYYDICVNVADANGCVAYYCDSSAYIYKMDEAMSMATVNVVSELPPTAVIDESVDINISPNPFNEQLIISTSYIMGAQYILSDITGKQILSEKITVAETFINTQNLKPGMYILTFNEGGHIINYKMVK